MRFRDVNLRGSLFDNHFILIESPRYLQNVCNHPKLVVNQHHPQYEQIIQDLQKDNSSLDNIEHSAKLPALK